MRWKFLLFNQTTISIGQKTGTYLWIYHDREAPLPNIASYAKNICRKFTEAFQSFEFRAHVSETFGANRVTYWVSEKILISCFHVFFWSSCISRVFKTHIWVFDVPFGSEKGVIFKKYLTKHVVIQWKILKKTHINNRTFYNLQSHSAWSHIKCVH